MAKGYPDALETDLIKVISSQDADLQYCSPMAVKIFGRPIWDWLRACGACGRALQPVDFFCDDCWAEFRARANRGAALRQPYDDVSVYALWTWNKENDVFLRPLIYALKGGWPAGPVKSLIEDLSFARSSLPLRTTEFSIVLPPRRPGRERDHAAMLAHEFGLLWQRPVCDQLKSASEVDSGPQKRKTAEQRRKTQFRFEGCADESKAWVLIDDVVTTGATVRAAFAALGSPAKFEAWALACRPPIAAFGGIC